MNSNFPWVTMAMGGKTTKILLGQILFTRGGHRDRKTGKSSRTKWEKIVKNQVD